MDWLNDVCLEHVYTGWLGLSPRFGSEYVLLLVDAILSNHKCTLIEKSTDYMHSIFRFFEEFCQCIRVNYVQPWLE